MDGFSNPRYNLNFLFLLPVTHILCIYIIHTVHYTNRIAFVVKNLKNPFFEAAYNGCLEESKLQSLLLLQNNNKSPNNNNDDLEQTISCDYYAPDTVIENAAAGQMQNDILESILTNTTRYYHGVAISPFDPERSRPYINKVMEAGIPVVTYDTDASTSKRMVHIGTDNTAFGEMLGKVLLQFAPLGGTYGTLAGFPAPNILERVKGLQHFLNGTTWKYEGPEHGVDGQGLSDTSIGALRNLMEDYPTITALVPVVGWPMLNVERWKEFAVEFNDLTFVAGDASPSQIELLEMGYANGLVGQLPSEMGRQSLSEYASCHAVWLRKKEKGTLCCFHELFLETLYLPVKLFPFLL